MNTRRKPNLLLIVADQLSAKALRAYGNSFCATPNLDRLFCRGVRFEQAYSNCPLCQPSRASFWTGRLPHETGVRSNGRLDPVEPIPETVPTLGSLFSGAGYLTAHFGKCHAAGGLRGFAHIEEERATPVEPVTEEWPLSNDTFRDRYTTEKVVEFLRGARGPYLAVADLNNPHDICSWVGAHEGAHVNGPIHGALPPLPPNFRDQDFADRPIPVQYVCCSHRRLAQSSGWNDENYRHYLAAYYHYVSRMDQEVGRILDALEARHDFEDTLVVFFGDHGDGMVAHQMITKQVTFHEECVRVPFVFAGGGIGGNERGVDTGPVSLLDLLPTLCEYAAIVPPPGLRGRSLLPWLRETRDDSPHDHVVSQWHTEWGFTVEPGRMLRTERYKYTCYLEGQGEELYDLEEDPGETRTLIHSAAHGDILQKHRALLERVCQETEDPFFTLSPQVDPRWRSHPPGYQNHKGPAAPVV